MYYVADKGLLFAFKAAHDGMAIADAAE